MLSKWVLVFLKNIFELEVVMFFNIYYINSAKVFEISMMFNNKVLKSVQQEIGTEREKNLKRDSELSASYLSQITGSISTSSSTRTSESRKMIENLEVKTTKSIMLKSIIEKCKVVDNLNNLNEGDLILLKNVKLELENKKEVTQIRMMANGAFEGIKVEEYEINKLLNAMIKDYSYLLIGKDKKEKRIMIKIPLQFENEFESNYSIDDLLVGEVTIIGIYKGLVSKNQLGLTSIEKLSDTFENQDGDIIASSTEEIEEEETDHKHFFVDTLSVVQIIFEDEDIEDIKSDFGLIDRIRIRLANRLYKRVMRVKK
jgi:hypothetical protein